MNKDKQTGQYIAKSNNNKIQPGALSEVHCCTEGAGDGHQIFVVKQTTMGTVW